MEKFCKESFSKTRVRKRNIKPLKNHISKLIDERNKLSVKPETPEIKENIFEISQQIAEDEAQENRNLIFKNFKDLSENPEKINLQQMWKLSKKSGLNILRLCPQLKETRRVKWFLVRGKSENC